MTSTFTKRSPLSASFGNAIPKSACAALSKSRSATAAKLIVGTVTPFF